MFDKHVPPPFHEFPKWIRNGSNERLVLDRYEEERVLAEWKPESQSLPLKKVDSEIEELPQLPFKRVIK